MVRYISSLVDSIFLISYAMYFPLDLCIYSENTACNQNSSSLLMSQNSACIFYCQQLAHLLRDLNDCPRCMFFFCFLLDILDCHLVCTLSRVFTNLSYRKFSICVWCARARAYVTLRILILTKIISSIILMAVICNSVVRIQSVTFIHL